MAKLKEVILSTKATVKTKNGSFISGEVIATYEIEKEKSVEELTLANKEDLINSVSEILGSTGNMIGAEV